MNKKNKNFFPRFLLGGLIVLLVFSFLFYSKPAKAQLLSVDLPHIGAQIAKFIKDFAVRAIDLVRQNTAAVMYKNFLNPFLTKFASEVATKIGTFGKEGDPLFFTDADYFTKMADSMAADFLDQAAKDFTGQGLCEPIDPTIKLNILLSLPVPKPPITAASLEDRCSLADIGENLANAAKEEIFQLNIRLQEGPAKFSTQLETMIDGRAFGTAVGELLKENNNTFIKILDKVTAYIDLVKKTSEEAVLGPGPARFQEKEGEFKELERWVGLLSNDYEAEATKIDNIIKECSSLPVSTFCSKDDCSQFCPQEENIGYVCDPTTFSQCLSNLNKTKQWNKEGWSAYNDLILSYSQAKDNKLKLAAQPTSGPDDIMKKFENQMTPESNPLGQIGLLRDTLQKRVKQTVENKQFQQILRGEFKASETSISGKTLFPAGMTEEQARQAVQSGTASEKIYTGVLAADVIGTFVNTLSSKLQETLMKWGVSVMGGSEVTLNSKTWEELFKKAGQTPPIKTQVKTPGTIKTKESINSGPASSPIQGRSSEEVRALYTSVLSTPLRKGEDINLLHDFVQCPTDPRYALPTNCVVDTAFARAVDEGLTIEEAINKKYLHSDWYVSAPDSHLGNVDSKKDFSKRYSLTNATILAQAGIMPLGFQIAADEISRNPSLAAEKFTLDQIVGGFYNKTSPFYKLVNPKWRLKNFSAQCDLTGYTSLPQPNSTERQEACLQWRTCTGENDDGTCHTWNYCTGYKNSWLFNADRCDSQYNSCQSYTKVLDKQQFAWLKNTLNFNCEASGVGCNWYCQSYNKNFGTTENWDCAAPSKKYVPETCLLTSKCLNASGCVCPATGIKKCTVAEGDISCVYNIGTVSDVGNAIFLNRLAESCSASNQGCNEFIRTKSELGTNLLANSSFENYTSARASIFSLGWSFTSDENSMSDGVFISDEPQAFDGKIFAKFIRRGALFPSASSPQIELLGGTKYSLSLYAKNINTTESRELSVKISGLTLPDLVKQKQTLGASSSWQLLLYEFIIPANVNKKTANLFIESSGSDILIDYLKLDTGKALAYQEYGRSNLIYLKKAPEYLFCYNRDVSGNLDQKDDAPECLNFARGCNLKDVGCKKYIPTNGDPSIPAVAKDNDFCPAECVGYDHFKEKATNFYFDRDVSLIPQTAEICSASEVGCESYTNVEEVNRGGEGREFYSYLRACQKLDGACANFYTWVGSETSGFELKKYILRKNIDGSPATILDQNLAEENWGKCRNDMVNGPKDARVNSNCKEFYAEDGINLYYQLYQNTVVCNDTCLQLRKNKAVSASTCWPSLFSDNNPLNNDPINEPIKQGLIDGLSFNSKDGENCLISSGSSSCSTAKGEVCNLGNVCSNANCVCYTGICTVTSLPGESLKCNASNEGCREYKGNNANTVRISFLDDFEAGTYYPWQPITSSLIDYTTVSVYFPGHSIKVREEQTGGSMKKDGLPSIVEKFLKPQKALAQTYSVGAEREVDGLIYANKFYLISFLIKGSVNGQLIDVKFKLSDISFSTSSGEFIKLNKINNDWQLLTLGPVYFNKPPVANEKIQITSNYAFWLDNVQLKDTGSLYLIKNSWMTPSSCEANYPEEMIGCLAYRDSDNQTQYLKSFSQICSDDVVGCEALINTQNSLSPFSEKFNNDRTPTTDDVTIFADQTEYLVYDKQFSCTEENKGCQLLGLPSLSSTDEPTTWSNVFLKNRPDDYERKPILCREGDQKCEEFTTSAGGTVYLKDPGENQCEWKDKANVKVKIEGGEGVIDEAVANGNEVAEKIISGWFKKDSDQPCYTDSNGQPYMSDENIYGIRFSDEGEYDNFVGVCPLATVGCQEFIDPIDTTGSNSLGGKSYYYLNNFKINKSACNGKVSLENGCILLKDVEDSNYVYNSMATYQKSQSLNGQLVTPISCNESSQPFKIGSGKSCGDDTYKETDYCKYCETNKQSVDDANLIIKVEPNRICSEWLHCLEKTKIWQSEINDYIEVCNKTVRCRDQIGAGEGATCSKQSTTSNDVLSLSKYQLRDVSWFGQDYGGYSLYNWRPVEALTKKISNYTNDQLSIPNQLLLTSYVTAGDAIVSCTSNDQCSGENICYNGKCTTEEVGISYSGNCELCPTGSFCQDGKCVVPLTTQAFPEKDSPFSGNISSIFKNVNVCSRGFVECKYFKGKDLAENGRTCEDTILGYDDYEKSHNIGCQVSNADCVEVDCNYVGTNGYTAPMNGFFPAGQDACNYFAPYCNWNGTSCSKSYLIKSTELPGGFDYFSCQQNYKKTEYGVGGSSKKYFNNYLNKSWMGVCISGTKDRIGYNCDPAASNQSSCGTGGQCEPITKEDVYYSKNNFCLTPDVSSPNYNLLKTCILWYPSAHLLTPTVFTDKNERVDSVTEKLFGHVGNFGADYGASGWFSYKINNGSWQETTHIYLTEDTKSFNQKIDGLNNADVVSYQAIASNNSGSTKGVIKTFTHSTEIFDFAYSETEGGPIVTEMTVVGTPGSSRVATFYVKNSTYPNSVPKSVNLEPVSGRADIIVGQPNPNGFSPNPFTKVELNISLDHSLPLGIYDVTVTGRCTGCSEKTLTIKVDARSIFSYVVGRYRNPQGDYQGTFSKISVFPTNEWVDDPIVPNSSGRAISSCMSPNKKYIFILDYPYRAGKPRVSRFDLQAGRFDIDPVELPGVINCWGQHNNISYNTQGAMSCAATDSDLFITCDEYSVNDKILHLPYTNTVINTNLNGGAYLWEDADNIQGPYDVLAEFNNGETYAYVSFIGNDYTSREGTPIHRLMRFKKSDHSYISSDDNGYPGTDSTFIKSAGGIAKIGNYLYVAARRDINLGGSEEERIAVYRASDLFFFEDKTVIIPPNIINNNPCFGFGESGDYSIPKNLVIGPHKTTASEYYLFLGCQFKRFDPPSDNYRKILAWKINNPNNPSLSNLKVCNSGISYINYYLSSTTNLSADDKDFFIVATLVDNSNTSGKIYRVGNIKNWLDGNGGCLFEETIGSVQYMSLGETCVLD